MSGSGYFGIGIVEGKTPSNVGTLWRSAHQLGASFIFTVGQRYGKQASDTAKTWRQVPQFEYRTREEFRIPKDCEPIGIEMGGTPLGEFIHPPRAIYLLGSEDNGLTPWALSKCSRVVSIEAVRFASFNVAVAGALVMYDRLGKGPHDDR